MLPLRILLISTPASLHTRTWLTELKNHGADVDLLFLDDWIDRSGPVPEELYSQARLLKLPSKLGLLKHSIRNLEIGKIWRDLKNHTRIHQSLDFIGPEIARIFHDGEYDIAHCHGVASALLLASASGIEPYSCTAWGSDIYIQPERNPYIIPLISKALEKASFIHVESEISANRIVQLAPTVKNQLFVSTWGVDTTHFLPGLSLETTQKHLAIPKCRYILSFRVLGPLYRVDFIIRAFSEIASKAKDLILVVGSDGPEREKLVELAQELQLSNKVFFTGFIDDEDKRALLSNAEVYVQFPTSDGVAISTMEAMSSGLPIVSSNAGETSVLVKDGENGILVVEENPSALASAILRILETPQLRKELAEKSRELAVERHNRYRFVELFLDKMREVIQHTG
ncbi:MAG: glycosyltransferase family 4 protein [Promethearchaeota archaeon]